MPKKCNVCSGEKYREVDNNHYECVFCGTRFTKAEIEETISEEQKSIELINRIGKAVCEIVWQLDEAVFMGTGWYIGNGNVITNAHVVLDPEGYIGHKFQCKFTYLGNNCVFVGEAEKVDKVNDVAIVKINEDSRLIPFAIKLADNPTYTIGQTVYTIGNTVGRGLSPQKGMISRLDDMEFSESWKELGAVPLLRTTLNIDHGNSGGPLINTKGEAIGLMSSGHVQQSEVAIVTNKGRMNDVLGLGQIKVDELSIAVRLICVKNLLASKEKYVDKQRPKIPTNKANDSLNMLLALQSIALPDIFHNQFELFLKLITDMEVFDALLEQVGKNLKVKYDFSADDFNILQSENKHNICIAYPDDYLFDNLGLLQVFSLVNKQVYAVLPSGLLVKIEDGNFYKYKQIDMNNLAKEIENL